jgi:hypothetical protein
MPAGERARGHTAGSCTHGLRAPDRAREDLPVGTDVNDAVDVLPPGISVVQTLWTLVNPHELCSFGPSRPRAPPSPYRSSQQPKCSGPPQRGNPRSRPRPVTTGSGELLASRPLPSSLRLRHARRRQLALRACRLRRRSEPPEDRRSMDARNRSLSEWFTRISTGQVQLPRFQRFEAWGPREIDDLVQTVVDELPAGAALILEIGDKPPFHSRPYRAYDRTPPRRPATSDGAVADFD